MSLLPFTNVVATALRSWFSKPQGREAVESESDQTRRQGKLLGRRLGRKPGWFLLLLAGFGLSWLGQAAGQESSKLSIEDVISMRRLHEVQISPDGSKVAFVIEEAADQDHSRDMAYSSLWVIGTSGAEEPRPYTSTPAVVSSPQWSPDGQTLAFLSAPPRSAGAQVYLIGREGKGLRPLTHHPSAVASFSWSPDGKKIAYLATSMEVKDPEGQRRVDLGYDPIEVGRYQPVERRQPRRLWTVEVESGQSAEVNVGDLHVMAVQWSPDGRQFLLTVADEPYPDAEQLHARLVTVSTSGGTPRLYCATSGKLLGPSWAPDGSSIAFMGSREHGTDFYPGGLFVCRGEGSTPQDLAEGSSFAPERVRWMPDSQSLLVPVAENAHRSLATISLRTRQVVRLTQPSWELSQRADYSISRMGERLACVLATSTKPPDIWTGIAGKPLERLTHLNPALEARSFGEGEAIRWKARDGWEVSGVLIKPVGYRQGVRYPLIVQLHGSNEGYANDFHMHQNDWGQVLATHGYAVFMADYRGSLMGSYQFRRGAHGDYCGRDSTDVLDGVDFLVQQGIADPDRLGVGGISYGGLLTNWLVTQTTRFKAAVSVAGFSNWMSIHGGEEPAPESAVWEQWGKSPYENAKLLWDRSPITHVGNVKTPTLIMAGELDPVLKPSQSLDFFRGLRYYGVRSQLIMYPREGHGLRESNHLRDYFQRTFGWFDEYLKPSP